MTGWNLPPGCTNADIERAMGGDDECYHEAFGIHIMTGSAECPACGEIWWATAADYADYSYRNEQFAKMYRRLRSTQRRRDLWRRLTYRVRWPLHRLLKRYWPRKSLKVLHDEEIPF